MLRRRMLLIMMSCYRWARAKTRVVLGGYNKVTIAQTRQAESRRANVIDEHSNPESFPATEGESSRSVQTSQFANPIPHEPVQGSSFRQMLIQYKAYAYSAFEAPGRKNGLLVLSRLANAITALGVVATNNRAVANRIIARANSADAIAVESTKGVTTTAPVGGTAVETESAIAAKNNVIHRIADPDSADAREATATTIVTIDRTAEAEAAQTLSVSKQAGVQNSAHTRAAFYIKNYVEDNVLILKQVYGATIEEHVLILDSPIYPTQTGTDLHIQQIYKAVQNGTNLNFNRDDIV